MASKRKADAIPGGGGGPNSAHRRFSERQAERSRTRSLTTQEWVNDKIASGDINGGMAAGQSGTSIFDPVLCELVYRWFCPPGGAVLDPFAGGSVRGIVASRLGRAYVGVDLSAAQIAANEIQAKIICREPMPRWVNGDSRTAEIAGEFDLIFTCPPYADLEVYSDDPRDLSTMAYDDFRTAFADIAARSAKLLRPDRFACIVVGEARGRDGLYYGLVPDTVIAFEAAGLRFYNEAILITAAGSLPIRTRKQFESSRKFGKTHQNVLIFCKGDPVRATNAIGEVQFGQVDGVDQAPPERQDAPPPPGDGTDPALRFGRIL